MALSDEEMEVYELAYTLRVPASVVKQMDYDEFLGWFEYFERRPAEWRDDHRAGMIMKAFNGEIKIEQIFPSLSTITQRKQVIGESLKTSSLAQLLLNAQGGDKDTSERLFKDG